MPPHGAFPVIRLEIEGMKHTILKCLSDYTAKMDADIQRAVENACRPENVTRVIEETAQREIKAAIDSELSRYFQYGQGREAIRSAVLASLKTGDESR